MFASPPLVDIVIDDPRVPSSTVPSWTQTEWAEAGATLSQSFGLSPITLYGAYEAEGVSRLDIHADAGPGSINVTLKGEGWQTDTAQARGILHQNLAHEMAHQDQFATGPTGGEPLWWHEGTAEIMALRALVGSGLWTRPMARAWMDAAQADCEAALSRGPLNAQWAQGDREAVYGCGFVMAATLVQLTGTPVEGLRAELRATLDDQGSMADFIAAQTSQGMARTYEAFAARSYGHVDGAWVIGALQSGEL